MSEDSLEAAQPPAYIPLLYVLLLDGRAHGMYVASNSISGASVTLFISRMSDALLHRAALIPSQ